MTLIFYIVLLVVLEFLSKCPPEIEKYIFPIVIVLSVLTSIIDELHRISRIKRDVGRVDQDEES